MDATFFNSVRYWNSLMGPPVFNGSFERMAAGTVFEINSSIEEMPIVSNISIVSCALGPICLCANSFFCCSKRFIEIIYNVMFFISRANKQQYSTSVASHISSSTNYETLIMQFLNRIE